MGGVGNVKGRIGTGQHQTSSIVAISAASPRRSVGRAVTRVYPPWRSLYRRGACSKMDLTSSASYT